MNLARFGVTRPVPVNLMMLTFLIAGVACGLTMTKEFFPEMTPEGANISLPYPGASPEEIEESLVKKVEDKLADLDEVERMTTTITEGFANISVEFRDGIDDVTFATDEIERAIDTLTDLPDEAERIQVRQQEPVLHTIMMTLYGSAEETVLKQVMRDIKDDLNTLPGMGDITLSGVRDYEIRVDVSADQLLEHGMSLPQVSDAISRWMNDVPGGTVRTDVGNVKVRTMGVIERAQAIREIVVKASIDGQVLTVGDIAEVQESYVDEEIKTRFRTDVGGGTSADLTIFKVGDQDAVEIAEMVRSYSRGRRAASGDDDAEFEPHMIDRVYAVWNMMAVSSSGEKAPKLVHSKRYQAYLLGLQASALPEGCYLQIHSDLARFIEGRLDLLIRNAKWGAVLVFATLLLVLNWRASIWVGVGLVTALAGTLLFMTIFNITLNLLTMFGLIVVLGLLVDDAIVVSENIMARHDRGEPSLVAAIKGTNQVFWPVVATVLTSIVAFLPLTFIRGTMGDLLGALPWVVTCALAMSLVESILILPSHLGHSLVRLDKKRARKATSWISRFENRRDYFILEIIVPNYAKLLGLMLRYRYISLSVAVATLTITMSIVAGGRLDFTFIPASDSETIIIDLKMPIGTALDVTEQTVQKIENAAMAQPETLSVSTLIGVSVNVDDTTGFTGGGFGSHVGQLFLELHPVEDRQANGLKESADVINAIRSSVVPLEGAESLKFAEIQGGPGGADITVQITGNNEIELLQIVDEVKALLATIEGVTDIADNHDGGQREVQVTLKPGAAALGFTVADVARQVRGALYGLDAHVYSDLSEDIDVRVRMDEASRRSLMSVENMWVIAPGGQNVPLQEIADLEEGNSYSSIHRIDRKRSISVTADTVPGLSPELVTSALAVDLQKIQQRHPNIGFEMGGRQRQLNKAFSSLPIGFLTALILVYIILAWMFGNYLQPLAVMLAIPFGLIGIVWGHLILGYDLTFLSLIGFVALSGIVVNDSLILVQFFNERRREGASFRDGLIQAGRQRLRPIFLTTLTTVLGLTPLMLEDSFQAKFLIPMAISLAFGLMGATVLILLMLPCVITIFDDIKGVLYFLWCGEKRPDNGPATLDLTNLDAE